MSVQRLTPHNDSRRSSLVPTNSTSLPWEDEVLFPTGGTGGTGPTSRFPYMEKSTRFVNRKNGPVPPVPPVHLTTPIPCQIVMLFLTRLKPRSERRMPKAFCRSGRSPFSSHQKV